MASESAREQLRRLGIRPRKGLGQHFLVNEGAADAIVAAALEPEPEALLEIGPGLGVLTGRLAESGLPLVAIDTPGLRRRKSIQDSAEFYSLQSRHPYKGPHTEK